MLNGRKGPFSKSILSSKIYECLLSFLILNWKKWINRRVQRSITVNVQWFFHVFVIIPSKTVFDAHRRFWIEQPCTISESHGRNSDGNVSKMKESLVFKWWIFSYLAKFNVILMKLASKMYIYFYYWIYLLID